MKKLFFVFIILLSFVCFVGAQQSWCGQQDAYFNNSATPDVSGYESLMNFPTGSPEVIENVTVTSASGPVLIDNYIMPVGSLTNAISLEPGVRMFRVFASVNSAVGTTRLNFTAFRRFANGTEENFYTALSGDINDLTVAEQDFLYVSSTKLMLNPTDRLGMRVSANTTQPSSIVVSWYYQGSAHYSMFITGFFDCEEQPTNFNESYAYSPSNATPLSEWVVIALISIGLFICAFYLRLRNEDGEISKERIVFSIVSSVVCGLAAYLSLEIIIPSGGLATSVVYQLPVIAILFTILSILAFANFIYCIMQKDMVQPDKKDYNNKMEGERK